MSTRDADREDPLSFYAEVPTELGKNLCACLNCKLVKTTRQFQESGCENCVFFNMEGDADRVAECTTVNFAGLMMQLDPKGSWCSRWQRTDKYVPGVYALKVHGVLSDELRELINNRRR
jgi:transcription elongation factor SPT4